MVCVIEASALMFSELLKVVVSLSGPVAIYCTKRTGCVVEVPALTPITCALTPDVAPVIVTGFVVFKYCETTTSSPPNCDASCIEV